MRAFFAETGNTYNLDVMKGHDIGRMWSRDHPYGLFDGEVWGLDNGAWGCFANGEPFDGENFLYRVEMAGKVGVPWLAVCPDIVMGGMRSLDFSVEWRSQLPDEFPWYLAVQEGMDPGVVLDVLEEGFAGVFLGGSARKQIELWVGVARRVELPIHFGRCGTRRALRAAVHYGFDSFDSATPVVNGRSYFDRFVDLYVNGDPQGELFSNE